MKQSDISGAPIGENQALRRQRRVWKAMLLPGAVALGILFAIKAALGGVTFTTSPAFAVAGAIVVAIFTLVGSIWHHRVIDEHEEKAILWSNTIGFYVLIATSFIIEVFELSGILPRISHVMVMMIAFVAALAAYLWNRFR